MKKLLLLFFLMVIYSNVSAQTSFGFGASKDDNVIIAYPNPAKDFLLLKVKDNSLKIKSVSIYSILGVQVAEFIINAELTEIRLDRLKSGKYLLRYSLSNNSQKTIQIIKQ